MCGIGRGREISFTVTARKGVRSTLFLLGSFSGSFLPLGRETCVRSISSRKVLPKESLQLFVLEATTST
jgi:hypothetical protein